MKSNFIEATSVYEFDSLTEKEQMVLYITHFRHYLYNRLENCGAKAIQEELRKAHLTPVPSISTINRILRKQYLTNGRTGYYKEDYLVDSNEIKE